MLWRQLLNEARKPDIDILLIASPVKFLIERIVLFYNNKNNIVELLFFVMFFVVFCKFLLSRSNYTSHFFKC